MAGMIDDFQDTLNEMLKAANLPVSIIVIKLGKSSEENDSEKFMKKAFPAFKQSERVFVDLLDFEKYKNEGDKHTVFYAQQFEYDLISNIPRQIEKFFEVSGYEVDKEGVTGGKILSALSRSMTVNGRERPNEVKETEKRASLFPGEMLLQNIQNE